MYGTVLLGLHPVCLQEQSRDERKTGVKEISTNQGGKVFYCVNASVSK